MEVFATELESLGLQIDRLPFSNSPLPDGRAGIAPPADLLSEERFQVLASTPADGELLLLINGPLDGVPAKSPELWTNPPFEPTRRDGRMSGRGAADMKGGFAIGALALRALRDAEPNLFAGGRLGILAVVEEECSGNGTLRSIAEHEIRLMDGLRFWAATIAQREPEPIMPPGENPYTVNLGRVHSGVWTSTVPSSAVSSVRIGHPRIRTLTAPHRARSRWGAPPMRASSSMISTLRRCVSAPPPTKCTASMNRSNCRALWMPLVLSQDFS